MGKLFGFKREKIFVREFFCRLVDYIIWIKFQLLKGSRWNRQYSLRVISNLDKFGNFEKKKQ